MMYDFIDVTERQITTPLPTEAVNINGKYLENIVEGYRTLYVRGRESLGVELNTYSVGTADGERLKGSRYPARTITVGFQLIAEDARAFRRCFNQLNNILSLEEADFIFNDETDKFFTGHPIMDADIEAGTNSVKGEWTIYCTYPFKRSVAYRTLSSTDASGVTISGNKAIFSFDYNGSYPARPLLRATFSSNTSSDDYTENGDCGYVAFYDIYGNIVQLGNPAVLDMTTTNKNTTLINRGFDSLSGWTAPNLYITSISDPNWKRGQGQTINYATGTGTLSKSVGVASSFSMRATHRMAVINATETGTFKASLKNESNVVVGFEIAKTGNGTAGQVKYIINNVIVGTDRIDLSQYNTSFGYCNKTPVYTTQTFWEEEVVTTRAWWDPDFERSTTHTRHRPVIREVISDYEYTQSNLNSSITKTEGTITFKIGTLNSRTFRQDAVAQTVINGIEFEMTGNLNTNAIRSVNLTRTAGVPFAEIPNVFTAGDIVEADCNSANVYLYRSGSYDGQLVPQYGALGNDWETFVIRQGHNTISASWSEWVNQNYKPKIELIFNEVFI